jgi:hypothetical protein
MYGINRGAHPSSTVIAASVVLLTVSVNAPKGQENLPEAIFTPHFIRINERGGVL